MATITSKFQWPIPKEEVYKIMVDYPLRNPEHTTEAVRHVDKAEVLGDFVTDQHRYFNMVYHFEPPKNTPFFLAFLARTFRRSLKTLAKCKWSFQEETLETRFEPFLLNWCVTITNKWSLSSDDKGGATQFWCTNVTCTLPFLGKKIENHLVKVAFQDYQENVNSQIAFFRPNQPGTTSTVSSSGPESSQSASYHWPISRDQVFRILVHYPTKNPDILIQQNPQLTHAELILDEIKGPIRKMNYKFKASQDTTPHGILKILKPFFPSEFEWITEGVWFNEKWLYRDQVIPTSLKQYVTIQNEYSLIALPDNTTRLDYQFTVKCTFPVIGNQIKETISSQGFQAFDEKVNRLINQLNFEKSSGG